jgi:exonuclease III
LPYTFDDEWIWKSYIKIGMWNVRSLFWSGALKVLHNVLSNLDFDVAVLQETRLASGIQKFDKFTALNSGSESKNMKLVADFM